MNDRPIQVGDMVMTIKPISCCGKGLIGYPFVVTEMFADNIACAHCGDVTHDVFVRDESGYIYELSRLKRIPPDDQPEVVTNEEEITA